MSEFMSDLNAFGQALRIVKSGKYKDDKAVCAIMETLKFAQTMLDTHLASQEKLRKQGYSPFMGYIKGAKGEARYHTNIYPEEFLSGIKSSVETVMYINEIRNKGECLIYVLNALGEDIEY